MRSKPNINRLIELHQLLISFQNIKRMSYLPGKIKDRENDVEHSYFLAMLAWFLAPHFPQLDRDRMIRLALAHDLVEVHAGDTFVFGKQEDIDTKIEREAVASKRLKEDWSDFDEVHDALEDYKNKGSEEAKFVYVLDKLTPAIVNYLSEGKSWLDHGVTIEMFRHEKEKKIPKDSPLYPYYLDILEFFQGQPGLFAEQKHE